MSRWLLYGAYGYTGRLVAERAVAAGERPVLAGRDGARVAALAGELGLDHVAVALDDPAGLAAALADVAAVAHCAGPFAHTAAPMVRAALAARVHYLDIDGEIPVLDAVLDQHDAAVEAGVALVPGAGFDVVPTDCLAAMTAARLPDATRLELAFRSTGGFSSGTARSAIGLLGSASTCRIAGEVVRVPRARRTTIASFPSGPARVTAVSWGDVATAPRSTGIGDVVVSVALPRGAALGMGLVGALARTPVASRVLTSMLEAAAGRMTDPSPERRAASTTEVWARVTNTAGDEVVGRLRTPDSYDLTADSVVRIACRLASGSVRAGAWTPSQALGAEFVLELDGVTVDAPAVVGGS